MTKSTKESGSKWVHTSSVTWADTAIEGSQRVVDVTMASKRQQLASHSKPLPSQILTFQRGLAREALKLPEREREMVLAEVLAATGLLRRFYEPEQ